MSRYTLLNRILLKVMAALLVLTLLMPLTPAAFAEESGSCGDDLNWSFEDGTLTITGKGPMTDYTETEPAPWFGFRDQITRLVLPDGLTSVGRMAFYGCGALTAVEIPDKVTEIGAMAFARCEALVILRLSDRLTKIGRSAFESCKKLVDLRLPESLTQIERRAFYRCDSLKYVTVPERVISMGDSVFAYCRGLIRAEILAPLVELPEWTFFGCTALSSIRLADETKTVGSYAIYDCRELEVVYYGGEPGDAEMLEKQITEGRGENTDVSGTVSTEEAGNSESGADIRQDSNGDLVVENTTVTHTQDSTVSVTTSTNITNQEAEMLPVEITATIINENGWAELLAAIEKADTGKGLNVYVYLAAELEVPADVLNALSGRNIRMKIVNISGAEYTLDFRYIGKVSGKDSLNLTYSLKLLDNVKYEQLQGITVYELSFSGSSNVNTAIAIQLPMEWERQTATLYQVKNGKLELIQSGIVDQKGTVYFYLGAVDWKTTYLIGMNIPWVSGVDANVPDSLAEEYGVDYQADNIEYVITGRKSSWGIGFLEVNKILIGFMLSTAAIVGLVMYSLNKRKLRRGVMPGWEDDEDDEN